LISPKTRPYAVAAPNLILRRRARASAISSATKAAGEAICLCRVDTTLTLADGLATFSVNRCHNPIENQPIAKVLTTQARVANFVIDDLRRRRLPIDGLLKQVGLRRADLANPEYRLPHVLVLRLIERAASLVGDASYGLRLGASRGTRDRRLLGFLLLNSPTLMDGMTNLQRYSRVVGEGENLEIERNGAHVVLRFREADPALRGLRQFRLFCRLGGARLPGFDAPGHLSNSR
jgi:hypothetical protein